jgi:hypothetical protein
VLNHVECHGVVPPGTFRALPLWTFDDPDGNGLLVAAPGADASSAPTAVNGEAITAAEVENVVGAPLGFPLPILPHRRVRGGRSSTCGECSPWIGQAALGGKTECE